MLRIMAIIAVLATAEFAWAGNHPIVSLEGKFPEEICPPNFIMVGSAAGHLAKARISFDLPLQGNLVLNYFVIGLNSVEPGQDVGVLLRTGRKRIKRGTAGLYLDITDSIKYHAFSFLKVQIKPSRSYDIVDSMSGLIGATDSYPWWARIYNPNSKSYEPLCLGNDVPLVQLEPES